MSVVSAWEILVNLATTYGVPAVVALVLTWLIHEAVLRDRLRPLRAQGQYRGFLRAHPPAYLGSYLLLFFGLFVIARFVTVGPSVLMAPSGDAASFAFNLVLNASLTVAIAIPFLAIGYHLLRANTETLYPRPRSNP